MSARGPGTSRVSQGAAAERNPSRTAGAAPKPRAKRTARPPKPGALLLFPGAGSAASHPSLRAIEQAVRPLPTTRADFPYRKEGRRAPDRPPKLLACVEEEAGKLAKRAKVDPDRLVLGGRSMGGRMCSIAVADGLPACGLVLISYPLHPPGKPDNLRIEHLPRIAVPCLFISGTKDPFGSPAELEQHTAAIAGPVDHVWVEGKGHDLKGADDVIAAAVSRWLAAR
jgi:predicted alpha/beta-hydrolase family hydrolase